MDKIKINEAPELLLKASPAPANTITFYADGEGLGSYNIKTGEFTGNIQKSAKVLFDVITEQFNTELSEARATIKDIRSILEADCYYDHDCVEEINALLKEYDRKVPKS